jgi:predicted RNA-binding Zn-ribbon protein involved in translation (DUF1610 family)
MGKSSRRLRRNSEKQAKKDLAQKVNMFDRLPSSCTACEKPFDKQNREMVTSWNVVVKDQDKQVNLYCPPCWDKANEILEDFKNRLMEKMQNDSEES